MALGNEANQSEMNGVIHAYVEEIKRLLGADFIRAVVYGSYARGEYTDESDIDIAVFTSRETSEFYGLIDKISEITFEYNVKYDVILSPVFQNVVQYERMLSVLPYYQSIQREGVTVG
ncbi:MAG: nucleotidyltransferase domain-containing protein [Clostridiales bacterium]|nr:nucleotidyltransferase domain-containing protein [Clostridiales bacterium]